MQVKYLCENEGCRSKEGRAYELIVQSESIMDEKNIATFFCPQCNQKLKCEGCRAAA